jgi:hypothetical protein
LPTSENSQKVMLVLKEFGFGEIGLSAEDFQTIDKVVQLGVPPVRVDILTSITGVDSEKAFSTSVHAEYGDVPVRYINREQFIRNKRMSGRKKDLSDIEALGEK